MVTFRSCSTAAMSYSHPALTAGSADGSGAVLIDATLGRRRAYRTLSHHACPV
ncbi:ribosomal RNA small subunit methyltransferase H domain protein [Mycobacteroides abscessus MAB_091912_2446]|uniref:Ribosomal RNA small subunit methyltransferase H domain protein n=1 Tax=Mycobacteroides abscessus MAB_091912_2446 TaxID=1335414 RepID=A0A829M4B1_9MYCO|nr:ribosomal RNA small subunit methyltransferase H domain protein [Mycobacteroides abscessus MAB_091912_2446]